MISKESVKAHFSKNAYQYNDYAHVQRETAQKLLEHIAVYAKPGMRVLEIGCGTGNFTELLLNRFESVQITAVDIAPGMIEVSKAKLGNKENIQWICADAEEYSFELGYDLIVSNVAFQWLNYPKETIMNLSGVLNESGIFAFSTFGENTFYELHNAFYKAAELLNIKKFDPPGQRFTERQAYKAYMQETGMQVTLIEEMIKEYHENTKSFLRSIKRIGANNSNENRRVQSPSLIKEMIRYYDQAYSESGMIHATYHCLFCMGTKNI